jgi:hypothetical protein
MPTDDPILEQITVTAQHLSPEDRLRLIQRVGETLKPITKAALPHYLIYGQFRGGRMSTDEDFLIAKWRPTKSDLNGP